MTIRLNLKHSANRLVLRALRARGLPYGARVPAVAERTRVPDPYMECGSHPDVVEWVWDRLGEALPADGRCLVYGTPALAHPRRGIVLAVAYGTAYALRIPGRRAAAALKAGCTFVRAWTGGGETNIQDEFGQDWFFGHCVRQERTWIRAAYREA